MSNLVSAGRLIGGLQEDMARRTVADIRGHVRDHWRSVFDRHAQGRAGGGLEDWAPVFEFDGMA